MSALQRLFGPAGPAAPLPYEPSSPEGLAARWVRWVAQAGPLSNPVADTTGEHASLHQPDDVWFLAGTFGGEVVRRCTVPAGRPLFVPVFTMWEYPAYGRPPVVERASGVLVVDGEPVALRAAGTPTPFEVVGAFRNAVTGSRRPVQVSVWGLWRLLDPLPAGTHELRLHGGDGQGFEVGATYHLQVA